MGFSTTAGAFNRTTYVLTIASGFAFYHWVQHLGAGPTLVRAVSSGGEHLRRAASPKDDPHERMLQSLLECPD